MAERKKHSSVAACSFSMYLLESGFNLLKSLAVLQRINNLSTLNYFDPSISSLVKQGLKLTGKMPAEQW